MAVAANADDYAASRVGIYFPGVNPTLDGQCVSLVKWFMGEMSSVPDWNAARGDARYVGKTLVAQGHAYEVPYAQRSRGDIVCYEYGQFGHIGVILSGNRTFEENVNWPGVASKIVDGARVYASRVGSMDESWRHDMHIYRLKSYNEQGANMPTLPTKQQVAEAYGKHNLNADGSATPATPQDLDYYSTQPVEILYATLLDHETALVHQLLNQAPAGYKPYDGPPLFTKN